MIDLKYLVVGTGRCGSVYMARLLTSLGIPCCHEGIFNYNGLEFAKKVLNGEIPLESSFCSTHDILNNEQKLEKWLTGEVVAESSYMAAPFLSEPLFNDVKIVHIVRNPLSVISSFVKDIKFFEEGENYIEWKNFVFSQLPELNQIKNPIERACYYYVNWNRMIENKCLNKNYIRLKIEDQCDSDLLKFLDVSSNDAIFTNKKINSWKMRNKDFNFGDLPKGKISKKFIEIAKQYGYVFKIF